MKRLIIWVIVVVAFVFSLSVSTVFAQDMCVADFDYDGDCDGTDASTFKSDFSRGGYNNPCPPDGPAPVPKTGQTTSYATGDDGDWEKGIEKPPLKERFTNNGDGTVTDNLTGLIWLRNANCFGLRTWNDPLSDCNGLSSGSCGLTDGSSAGEWRLPNYKELFSLVHAENFVPALPSGHPFTNVQSDDYWSSTTYAENIDYVWFVSMRNGDVYNGLKSLNAYVWPVRGGH